MRSIKNFKRRVLTWVEVWLAVARLLDEPVHALEHAVVPRVVPVVEHVALVREAALPLALCQVPHGVGAPYICKFITNVGAP